MYIEIPKLTRCCVCVPLRHGILIYGYLNVGFCLFIYGILIWVAATFRKLRIVPVPYRGIFFDMQIGLPLVIYSVEIVFNVLLVVAAHKKNYKLLKIYFYYGILTTIATFICFLLLIHTMLVDSAVINILTLCVAFSGLVLHGYLLLLVKNEMKKLKHNQQLRFVNNMIDGDLSRPPNGNP